jgi:hypothetical protein
MAFTPSKLRQIHDCLDRMSKRMDEMEEEQLVRHDADDRELEEELAKGNTMPTPTHSFSDSPPEKIHGKLDQELWPRRSRAYHFRSKLSRSAQ